MGQEEEAGQRKEVARPIHIKDQKRKEDERREIRKSKRKEIMAREIKGRGRPRERVGQKIFKSKKEKKGSGRARGRVRGREHEGRKGPGNEGEE